MSLFAILGLMTTSCSIGFFISAKIANKFMKRLSNELAKLNDEAFTLLEKRQATIVELTKLAKEYNNSSVYYYNTAVALAQRLAQVDPNVANQVQSNTKKELN